MALKSNDHNAFMVLAEEVHPHPCKRAVMLRTWQVTHDDKIYDRFNKLLYLRDEQFGGKKEM